MFIAGVWSLGSASFAPGPSHGRPGTTLLQNDIDQPLKKSQHKTPLPRHLQNPVPIEGERGDAGQSAAAGAAVRPRRPADHADDGRAALLIFEYRAAGIPGAGP